MESDACISRPKRLLKVGCHSQVIQGERTGSVLLESEIFGSDPASGKLCDTISPRHSPLISICSITRSYRFGFRCTSPIRMANGCQSEDRSAGARQFARDGGTM